MEIATRIGADILSVDSMQVYRGMDIGTAKPTPEDRAAVSHHMIDVVEPEEEYSVEAFRRAARAAAERVANDRRLLVVGGSGLHFRSIVDPMRFRPSDPEIRLELERVDPERLVEELTLADPDAAHHVDLANPRRVVRAVEALRAKGVTPTSAAGTKASRQFAAYQPEVPFQGVLVDRDDTASRVHERLGAMRRQGFLEEVGAVAPRLGRTASQAVGYRQLVEVIEGRMGVEEGFIAAERATMKLVKRQRTYFRRDPRLTSVDGSSPRVVEKVMGALGL